MKFIPNKKQVTKPPLAAVITNDGSGIYFPSSVRGKTWFIGDGVCEHLPITFNEALILPGRTPVYEGEEITIKF